MLNTIKNGAASRQTWARRTALLVLILLIAVFLMAQLTIIAYANHVCIGDGCPICKLIHNSEMLLRLMGKNIVAISALLAALFIIASAMINNAQTCAVSYTLFGTKVRLNI